MRIIFTEHLLYFGHSSKNLNISHLVLKVVSWKCLFPFCQWGSTKLREIPKRGTRIWNQIWPTPKCLLTFYLPHTIFLSGTQKESWERTHLSLSWNLEGFGGRVRFLSKEGRGIIQRRNYCNGPHKYSFIHAFKQHLLSSHYELGVSSPCEHLVRRKWLWSRAWGGGHWTRDTILIYLQQRLCFILWK